MNKRWLYSVLLTHSLFCFSQQNSTVSIYEALKPGDAFYLNDQLVTVITVEQATKMRVVLNRYQGELQSNEILLAQIKTHKDELLILRQANDALEAAQINLLDMNRNREDVIALRDEDIRRVKRQRTILGALLIIAIIL